MHTWYMCTIVNRIKIRILATSYRYSKYLQWYSLKAPRLTLTEFRIVMNVVGLFPQANTGVECSTHSSSTADVIPQENHVSIDSSFDGPGIEQDHHPAHDESSVADSDCHNDAFIHEKDLKNEELGLVHFDDSGHSTAPLVLSLEEITGSSYYHELADTAVTRNIDFFASFCRHKVGERLACLKKHFTKLSQGNGKYYSFGRVLYLTMLWEEGVAYINSLSEQQIKEEMLHCSWHTAESILSTGSKNHLMQWLKVIAQSAINNVVSQLHSNSLDILNAMAEDEEAVMISDHEAQANPHPS